jgi:hypothetical protein
MKKALRYPPIAAQFPHLLHGSDYNPDQWLTWRDAKNSAHIWEEDIRLTGMDKTELAPWEVWIYEEAHA